MKISAILQSISIFTTSIFLSSCALVPEKIHLKQKVEIQQSDIGQNHKVYLTVIDARDTDTIGGRPSGYGPAGPYPLGLPPMVSVSLASITVR